MIKMLEDLIKSAKDHNRREVVLTVDEVDQLVKALQEKEKPKAQAEFRATTK